MQGFDEAFHYIAENIKLGEETGKIHAGC